MKIYDITQELFSAHVYPGDKKPAFRRVSDMEEGALCNITEFEMNAHNGTHVDAPRHFVKDGTPIEGLDLATLVGPCTVAAFDGPITEADIFAHRGCVRLIAKGKCRLTEESARALSACGVKLFGLESQSIAGDDPPLAVHVEVLSHGIVALEGLDLSAVEEGDYFLFAAPLKLAGSDGSPCRAVLVSGLSEA
ncbi:MAG: cyclase family protein [Clostridia bacterium]|nr:cyclase family protein [Clostridia bacterium]MBR4185781.1 cyclase family protein [Clostridia bacterium]